MDGNVPFNLLHHLVDVAVKNGDRPKSLQQSERLRQLDAATGVSGYAIFTQATRPALDKPPAVARAPDPSIAKARAGKVTVRKSHGFRTYQVLELAVYHSWQVA
jgi:hypothetical protein